MIKLIEQYDRIRLYELEINKSLKCRITYNKNFGIITELYIFNLNFPVWTRYYGHLKLEDFSIYVDGLNKFQNLLILQ